MDVTALILSRLQFAFTVSFHIIGRWLDRPYLFVLPAISLAAAAVAVAGVRRRQDGLPFYIVILIFMSAFGTLAISFWPYMIAFVITVNEAAAPKSSLAFMFWGEGLFEFLLMLIYTLVSYHVFRGKVRSTAQHY